MRWKRKARPGKSPAGSGRDILWVLLILAILATGFCLGTKRLEREIELHRPSATLWPGPGAEASR